MYKKNLESLLFFLDGMMTDVGGVIEIVEEEGGTGAGAGAGAPAGGASPGAGAAPAPQGGRAGAAPPTGVQYSRDE